MDYQSRKAELCQRDLMPIVKQYLGSVLFRNVYQYETITATHANFIDFNLHKLPPASSSSDRSTVIPVEDLFIGHNSDQCLHLRILRILQYNHALVCMVLDEFKPTSSLRNAVLVVVFSSRELARKWSQENPFLTSLRLRNPYKAIHKFYTALPFLVARPESIDVLRTYLLNRLPEAIKSIANQQFREKQFEDALQMYELGVGLLTDNEKRRERAVLYANSSQCLYEMRLFASALRYAEISIALDRTYVKGLYRKLNCLLELDSKEVPRVITAMALAGSGAEAQEAQIRYTRCMANETGLFDWMDIFMSPSAQIGQYVSSKLDLRRINKREVCFIAEQDIAQFELVLVHKPLIYRKSEGEFGEEYAALTRQIGSYSRYEELFFEKFQGLPSQLLLHGQPLAFQRSASNEAVEINEIHSICLRCLELEKSLERTGGEVLGIWEKLYAFRHSCLPNCTYLHVKGALVVFAVRPILKEETLSVDFLSWETVNRTTFMREKLGRTCDCPFCSFQWQHYHHTPPQLLQMLTQQGLLNSPAHDKIALYLLCELIDRKSETRREGKEVGPVVVGTGVVEEGSGEGVLVRECLLLVQRYPVWECVVSLLGYLRRRAHNDVFDLIKATLKRILEKYFKLNHQQAVTLLKSLL